MNFLEIVGLIFIILLGIAFCIFFYYFILPDIKDFLYGLFTWQKKVAVGRDIGNNSISNMFAFLFPVDHYEWHKRETPKWIEKLKKIFKLK